MDELYYFLFLIAGTALMIWSIYFSRKHPQKPKIYKLRLLYFDGEMWYVDAYLGDVVSYGFIELPEESYKVGEEVEAIRESILTIQHFALPENDSSLHVASHQVRLRYFDGEMWYCETEREFGFIELEKGEYCIGDELEVMSDGVEGVQTFRPLNEKNSGCK